MPIPRKRPSRRAHARAHSHHTILAQHGQALYLHSIAHVKTLLQNEHGVPADHFRLFMKVHSQAGQKDVMLEETRTLSDYNVKRESMLHLVARLRGARWVRGSP